MKPSKIFHFTFLPAITIFLTSCMASFNTSVMQPADMTLPDYIKTIAVVERIKPAENRKAINIIEGVLTGEGIYNDREASGNCLMGFKNKMSAVDRFTVKIPTGLDLRGTGTGKFPTPLQSAEIEKIAQENNVDALLVLELLDSDYILEQLTVTAGWRLYDVKKKSMIDEHRSVKRTYYPSNGSIVNYSFRMKAVRDAGFFLGADYAARISPNWVTIQRSYYKTKSSKFKTAHHLASVRNWAKASELWKEETANPNKKIAGRACYNMALASEMMGQLDLAVEWANKAVSEGNNKAPYYLHQLQLRQANSAKLKQQMEGVKQK